MFMSLYVDKTKGIPIEYDGNLNWATDKAYISRPVQVIDSETMQKIRIVYNFVGEIAN